MANRLLKAAGVDDGELLANDSISEFAQDPERWWSCYTDCITFGEQSQKRFHHRVHTDGVSVSMIIFDPEPKQATKMGNLQQPRPTTARKRAQQPQISTD